MRQLLNARVAILLIWTVVAIAMLADNFTPTRAAIWGATWAIVATLVVRHELKRTHPAH